MYVHSQAVSVAAMIVLQQCAYPNQGCSYADVNISESSLLASPASIIAGQQSNLRLNLTDSFGNTVTDSEIVARLLNASSFQLLLKSAQSLQESSLAWSLGSVGPQGVSIGFSSNQTGRLGVSLVLGGEQLQDRLTGQHPYF